MIADDHPIFRDGLRRLLEAESDLKVIGEACDGTEAVKMARQLKPDIMLLDLAMPRMPGLEALREMSTGPGPHRARHSSDRRRREEADCRSSPTGRPRSRVEGFRHPAAAEEHPHRDVGEYWVGRESVSNLVQYLRNLVQSSGEEAKQKKFGLTPRELEIVSAVVAGLLQQGNRGILQDQRRYGEASSQQYLRQTGSFDPPGIGPFRGKSGLAAQNDRLRTSTLVLCVSTFGLLAVQAWPQLP